MKLWGGAFRRGGPSEVFERFFRLAGTSINGCSTSISAGSIAYASALGARRHFDKAGSATSWQSRFQAMQKDSADPAFWVGADDEDVSYARHSQAEGGAAGHAGRTRSTPVAAGTTKCSLDIRFVACARRFDATSKETARVDVCRCSTMAKRDPKAIVPGYNAYAGALSRCCGPIICLAYFRNVSRGIWSGLKEGSARGGRT